MTNNEICKIFRACIKERKHYSEIMKAIYGSGSKEYEEALLIIKGVRTAYSYFVVFGKISNDDGEE